MRASTFILDSAAKDRMVTAYNGNKGIPFMDISLNPAGGAISSLNDMTIFLNFLLSAKDGSGVITDASFAEMRRPQFTEDRGFVDIHTGIGYGLGLMIGGYDISGIEPVISHGGLVQGFSTEMALSREHRTGVFLFADSTSAFYAGYDVASTGLQAYLEAKTGMDLSEHERKG